MITKLKFTVDFSFQSPSAFHLSHWHLCGQ